MKWKALKKSLAWLLALALAGSLMPALAPPAQAAPGPCLLDFENPGELTGFDTTTVTYANTASGATFIITAEASKIVKGTAMDYPALLHGTEDMFFGWDTFETGVTVAVTGGKTFDLRSFYLFNNNNDDSTTYTVTTDQSGSYVTSSIPAGTMVQVDPPDTAGFQGITWFKITPTDPQLGGAFFALDDISVNIPPVFSSGAAASCAENAAGPAYTASASGSGTVTYSLPSVGDNALFSINATTGAVSFVGAPDYENPRDTGTDNVYDVTVQAEDSYGTATKAVAITVTDADDIHFSTSDNDLIVSNAIAKTQSVAGGGTVDVSFATYPANGSAYTCVYGPNENGTFPGGLYNYTGVDSNVGLRISVPAGYSFDLTSFKYAADRTNTPPVSEIDVGTASDPDAYGAFSVTQDGSLGYTILKSASPIADDVNEVVISAAGYVQMQDFEITDIKHANITPAFVGATTALTVDQDAAATDIKSLLHVSDADSGQTLTWSQSSAPSHGTLSFGSATADSGGTELIPSGTITYTPTPGYAGSDSFTVQVGDGTATATRTITVTVRSSDAGLAGVAGQTDSTTTGAGTSADPILWSVAVANAKSALSLSDISAASGAGKKLYSDSGFTNEITGENTLALSVGVTTAYIKVTAEDTATIRYYAVAITRAAAPSIAQNSGLTVLEGGTGTIANTRLRTTDADTGAANLTYTVGTAPTHGTLQKSGVTLAAGGTFTQDDVDNSRITYTHDGGETASDSFTFSVSDGANEITGQTFGIIVTPVNDAPTLTATTSTPTFTEGGPAVSLFSGTTIDTVESGQAILSLTLTVSNVTDGSNEVLTVDGTDVALTNGNSVTTDTNGMTGSVSVTSGTAVVSISKAEGISVSAARTLVNGITYKNTGEDPTAGTRTVTLTSIQDNGGTANSGADTASLSVASAVTVTPVNDAPVLASGSGTPAYTENGTAVAIAPALTVNDPDNTTLVSATISVTSGFQAAQDTLEFANSGSSAMGNIAGTYNAATGVLSLTSSGGTATLAQWQAALRAVTYSNSSDDPNTSGRTISFTVSDGQANSAAVTKTVTVTAVNDAPANITLSASTILAASTGAGATVGTLSATDPDSSDFTYSLVSGTGDTDNASFQIPGGTLQTAAALATGTYSIRIQVSDGAATFEKALTVTVANAPAPELAADSTNNDADHDIEITFAADAAFTAAITGVSFNGHALAPGQYTVDTANHNKVTLRPSDGTNSYLRTPATADVVIHAADYADAAISQTITAGAVNTLEVTAQPVPGAETGDAFGTQPKITLKDQYGNVCADGPSASAGVTASAAAGTGTWTLGGTATVAASAGVVTFSGLTCTLNTSGTGKMGFECGGKNAESNAFTIPERDSSLTPAAAGFDLYESSANYKDVVVTLTLNGNTLTAVKNGAHTLAAGMDYALSGSTLTIKKEYLKTLSAGTVNFTFDFSLGTDRTLTVTVANSAPAAGGDSGSGGAPVLVNGKPQTAGTAQTSTGADGRTTTTVTVDTNRLETILAAQGTGATVTIPITGGSNTAAGALTGDMIKSMENKDATLVMQTNAGTYTLPASQINIDAISRQLGADVSLSDISVTVSVSEPSASMTQVVKNAAEDGGYTIMVPAVDYTITCAHGGQTVNVSNFNAYVERTVAIPDGVDPAKVTTGVVVEPNGTIHHVPTRVTVIDGKYYAVINSLTNSTYSVIWNPVEFSDLAGHWARDAINDMGSRMVVTGVGNGKYAPDRSVTRGEFAAIMVRALGLEPGTVTDRFRDVHAGDWCGGYIETAAAYGIIRGYDNGSFGTNDTITREQAMTIIARAMQITGVDAGLTGGEAGRLLDGFSDGAQVSAYAADSAAACLKTGITSGTGSEKLSPGAHITRAEVAVMVQRLLRKSGLI